MNKKLAGKTGYVLGFLACFGIVAMALVIQTQNNLEPCPLCISQRIVFMCLGVLFLLSGWVPAQHWFKKLLTLIQVLTALGGVGVAIRHWWLQAHKEDVIADCGVGFDYMFENFPLQKAFTLIFRGTGDCAAIDWTLFGLSLPQLALICYVFFAFYAIYLYKYPQS